MNVFIGTELGRFMSCRENNDEIQPFFNILHLFMAFSQLLAVILQTKYCFLR